MAPTTWPHTPHAAGPAAQRASPLIWATQDPGVPQSHPTPPHSPADLSPLTAHLASERPATPLARCVLCAMSPPCGGSAEPSPQSSRRTPKRPFLRPAGNAEQPNDPKAAVHFLLTERPRGRHAPWHKSTQRPRGRRHASVLTTRDGEPVRRSHGAGTSTSQPPRHLQPSSDMTTTPPETSRGDITGMPKMPRGARYWGTSPVVQRPNHWIATASPPGVRWACGVGGAAPLTWPQ